jgi:NADH-quinone oxidoreductase subunit A
MPSYLPIVILGVIALGFGVFVLVASSTYECGVPPVGNARERFPIKFYLVCMMFILFDVETAFFYPWALIMDTLGVYGLTVMGGFFFVLGVGFVYEWKVGAMDW